MLNHPGNFDALRIISERRTVEAMAAAIQRQAIRRPRRTIRLRRGTAFVLRRFADQLAPPSPDLKPVRGR